MLHCFWDCACPPRDFEQYAGMVQHIARHLNEGWRDGHHWGVRYWEVWNEPDSFLFWQGTEEEYFELYSVVAHALKELDENLLLAGPSAGSPESSWIPDFITYCRENAVPVDIVVFHSYSDQPASFGDAIRYVDDLIGEEDMETGITEWNIYSDYGNPAHDTIEAAVHNASVLIELNEADAEEALAIGNYDHLPAPDGCSVVETWLEIMDLRDGQDHYYLVIAQSNAGEGSYGQIVQERRDHAALIHVHNDTP